MSTTMKTELETVYPFVSKWMKEKGCDFEKVQDSGNVIFANDFIEYVLGTGYFGEPRLRAFNVEMTVVLLCDVPLPDNEERFLALMELL